jgi:hypothetical protein
MKNLLIYKQNKKIRLHGEAPTTAGFLIAVEPYYVLTIESGWDIILEKIQEILEINSKEVPIPSNWSLFNKEFLKKMQVKSLKELYKNSNLCRVEQEREGVIKIIPYQSLGLDEGFEPLEHKSKTVSDIKFHRDLFIKILEDCLS